MFQSTRKRKPSIGFVYNQLIETNLSLPRIGERPMITEASADLTC